MIARICFIVLISLQLKAQDQIDFFLSSFQADVFDKEVMLRFTIRSGSVCSDLVIERSANAGNFEEVYRHFGVCGFTDRDAHYHFIDHPSENGIFEYRIVIYGNIISKPLSVKFFLTADGHSIAFPNPVSENLSIRFDNQRGESFDYFIYNSSGHLILQGLTTLSLIELKFAAFSPGIYYYTITNENHLRKGRFIKN
jgi:hypothetical protein